MHLTSSLSYGVLFCFCSFFPFRHHSIAIWMQSPDGNQLWYPGQSLWSLIAEHVTGSELPKIRTALSNSLVDMYTAMHSEVRGLMWLQKVQVFLLVTPWIQLMKLVSHSDNLKLLLFVPRIQTQALILAGPTRIPHTISEKIILSLVSQGIKKFAELSLSAQTIYEM